MCYKYPYPQSALSVDPNIAISPRETTNTAGQEPDWPLSVRKMKTDLYFSFVKRPFMSENVELRNTDLY